MNEQILKDFIATAQKYNYNWNVVVSKFPELKDYDLQLLKDYVATAENYGYDYSIINPKFPEFGFSDKKKEPTVSDGEPKKATSTSDTQPQSTDRGRSVSSAGKAKAKAQPVIRAKKGAKIDFSGVGKQVDSEVTTIPEGKILKPLQGEKGVLRVFRNGEWYESVKSNEGYNTIPRIGFGLSGHVNDYGRWYKVTDPNRISELDLAYAPGGLEKSIMDQREYIAEVESVPFDRLINSSERDIINYIEQRFGDKGVTVFPSGINRPMQIQDYKGKTIDIRLTNSGMNDLKEFLKDVDQSEFFETEKMSNSQYRKWQIEKYINEGDELPEDAYDLVKSSVNKNISEAKAKKVDLENEVEKVKLEIAKNGSKMTPELKVRLDEIEVEKTSLQEDFKVIASQDKQIEAISGMLIEKRIEEEKNTGSFVGGLYNKFLEGFSNTVEAEAGIAMDVMPYLLGENMIPESQKDRLRAEGLTEEEIRDVSKKRMKKDIIPAIDKGLVNLIGSSTTDAYMNSEDRNMFEQALFGLSETIPALILGGGNRTMQLFSLAAMSYAHIESEMMNNPAFENVSENEKKLISVPYAIGIGYLERLGFTQLLSKSPGAKTLLNKVISSVVKNGEKNFERAIKKGIDNELSKGVFRIIGGAIVEAETGGAQEAYGLAVKDLYNYMKDEQMFEDPSLFSMEGLKQVGKGAALESIGAAFMRGAIETPTIISRGLKSSKVNKELANIMRDFSGSAEMRGNVNNYLKTKIMSGEMTTQEAKQVMQSYDETMAVMSKIPTEVSEVEGAFDLLLEKQRLKKEMDGMDKSLVADKAARVTEINKELESLTKTQEAGILSESIDIYDDRNRKGLVPVEQLKDFIGEDRAGDAEMPTSRKTIDKLKEDIKRNGFKEPIVVVYDKFSGEGEASIIEGNHRMQAAIELGLKEVPVKFEKGTLRTDQQREADGMFPLNRKTVGEIDTRFGVDGTKLGLDVRQPTETDIITKLKEDAIQKQAAGKVPVQPEAKVGEEMEEGAPTSEPQVVTEEGQKRIDELEAIIEDDNKSIEEDGKGKLLPEARAEIEQELETLKSQVETAQQVEEATTDKGISETTLANEITLDNRTEFTDRAKPENKSTVRAANAVVKALNKLGVRIFLHNNTDEYNQAIADSVGTTKEAIDMETDKSNGEFIVDKNEIHIDLENADAKTVFHEAFHAIVKAKGFTAEDMRTFVSAVKRSGNLSQELSDRLDDFASNYESGEVNEEFLSELVGDLSATAKTMNRTQLQKLADAINALFSKIGLGNPLSKTADRKEIIDFLNGVSTSLRQGREIDVTTPGEGGEVGTFNIPSGRKKSMLAPSSRDDSRGFIKRFVEDVDLREFNGQNFVTNMYDYTGAGTIDLGNGNEITLLGGKNYVPYMMDVNGKSIGDVSNLAAFNTKAQAETFIRNAVEGNASLFAPHSGTLSNSWQFQQHTFSELVNLVLDKGILSEKELIKTFNDAIKNNAQSKKAFKAFTGKYGERINNFNSFKNNPKKIVELLDIKNNYSPDLRKVLNNAISANKVFQKAIGVKNKSEFYDRIMDPMNEGVVGGEIMGVVKFDPNTFEIVQTKENDTMHHPSFGWTLLAKINGIYQPTEFHRSSDVTDTYTKYNTDGKKVSRKSEDKNFEQRNVSSSAGAIPKVGKVDVKRKKQLAPSEQVFNKVNRKMQIAPGNRMFNEPLTDAKTIADEYMSENNIDIVEVDKIRRVDEARAKRISDEYDKMANDPNNPEVKEAYEAMVKETMDQYEAITSKGYFVEINNSEPYSSSAEMIQDLRDNKRFKVLSTEAEFGDTPITDAQRKENILLTDSGKKDVNGKTLLVNDVFRFVHDFFGHAKLGNGFGPIGEENAWRVHSVMYSDKARRAMTSETRGQNSFVNFSGINDAVFKKRDKARQLRKEGKIEQADKLVEEVYNEMKFADQKIGLMPEWTTTEGAPKTVRKKQISEDGKKKAIDDAKAKYELSKKRGNSEQQAIDAAINDLKKNDWYNESSDVDRDAAIRQLRKELGLKEKSAPSVQKLGLKPKRETQTESVNALRKEFIEAWNRAYREGAKSEKDARVNLANRLNEIVGKIKGMVKGDKLKTIINRALKMNLSNPVMADRFADYVIKTARDAEYGEKLTRANKIKKSIRKAMKSKDALGNNKTLAKMFLSIDPKYSENIDEYIEYAEKVLESLDKTKVARGELSIRQQARVDKVNEFIEKSMENQDKIKMDMIELSYPELFESKALNRDMTPAEAMSIIQAIDFKQGDKKISEKKLAEIRSRIGSAIDSLAAYVEEMIRTGVDPISGEKVSLSKEDIKVMKDLIAIDQKNLSIKQMFTFIDLLQNAAINQETFAASTFIEYVNGGIEAKSMYKKHGKIDPDTSRTVKTLSPGSGATITINTILGGVNKATDFILNSGFDAIKTAKSNATTIARKAVEMYDSKFNRKKPNGKSFDHIENRVERGMYAFIIRSINGSSVQGAKEFSRRLKLLRETVLIHESPDADQRMRNKAEVIRKVADKLGIFEDGVTEYDIISRVDKTNTEAVQYWIDKFADHYEQMSDVSKSIYNKELSADINYTPDSYRRIDLVLPKDIDDQLKSMMNQGGYSRYDMESSSLTTATRPNALPSRELESGKRKTTMYLDLDFDYNVSNAFQGAMIDVYTARPIKRFKGFVDSDAFESMVSNADNRKVLLDSIEASIMSTRGISRSSSSRKIVGRLINSVASAVSTIGGAVLLGKTDQLLKQTVSMIANTGINSFYMGINNGQFSASIGGLFLIAGKDTGFKFSVVPPIGQVMTKSYNNWLRNNGVDIVVFRGAESMGTIDPKKFKVTAETRLESMLDNADALSRMYVDAFLVSGDKVVAKSAFLMYYNKYMVKNGMAPIVDFSKPMNEKAKVYAMTQVSKQQGESDADMNSALFSSDRDLATRTMVKILLPLSSFIINKKVSIVSDLFTLGGKKGRVTAEDRSAAFLSLSSAIAEITVYSTLSIMLRAMIYNNIAAAITGYDEEEEDKFVNDQVKLENRRRESKDMDKMSPEEERAFRRIKLAEKKSRQYKGELYTNLIKDLSPLPPVFDYRYLSGVEVLRKKIQEDYTMTDEIKKAIKEEEELRRAEMSEAEKKAIIKEKGGLDGEGMSEAEKRAFTKDYLDYNATRLMIFENDGLGSFDFLIEQFSDDLELMKAERTGEVEYPDGDTKYLTDTQKETVKTLSYMLSASKLLPKDLRNVTMKSFRNIKKMALTATQYDRYQELKKIKGGTDEEMTRAAKKFSDAKVRIYKAISEDYNEKDIPDDIINMISNGMSEKEIRKEIYLRTGATY